MALEFVAQPSPDEGLWPADRRLYLSADERIVDEGDPDAAFLLVGEGGFIPLALALRHGLIAPATPVVPAADVAQTAPSEEAADVHGDTTAQPDAGS